MDIGIGLPNAVPGTSGEALLNWARAADSRLWEPSIGSCIRTTSR